jgi:hypothetical protein
MTPANQQHKQYDSPDAHSSTTPALLSSAAQPQDCSYQQHFASTADISNAMPALLMSAVIASNADVSSKPCNMKKAATTSWIQHAQQKLPQHQRCRDEHLT